MRLPLLIAVALAACNPFGADDDGDGYPETVDCNDDSADVNPAADEICDGSDNDCDGLVDEDDPDVTGLGVWYPDGDGDGFADNEATAVFTCEQPTGYVTAFGDCDDGEADAAPDLSETCGDGVDNDCNGLRDCNDDACLGDSACAASLTAVEPSWTTTEVPFEVTITGAGFQADGAGNTWVTVAGEPCDNVDIVSDDTITCDARPLHVGGTVSVVVSNDHGDSSGTLRASDCLFAAVGRSGNIGTMNCVDLDAGEVIELSTLSHALSSMTFLPDGSLVAVQNVRGSSSDVSLLDVDIDGGACTVIGPVADSVSGDIHYSIPDITTVGGKVLGWSETLVNGGYDDLIEINPDTGVVTKVFSDTGAPYTSRTGLASDADQNMYLLSSGPAGPIYYMDPMIGSFVQVGTGSGTMTYGSSGEATFHRGVMYAIDCQSGSSEPGPCNLVEFADDWSFTTTIELPNAIGALASRTP